MTLQPQWFGLGKWRPRRSLAGSFVTVACGGWCSRCVRAICPREARCCRSVCRCRRRCARVFAELRRTLREIQALPAAAVVSRRLRSLHRRREHHHQDGGGLRPVARIRPVAPDQGAACSRSSWRSRRPWPSAGSAERSARAGASSSRSACDLAATCYAYFLRDAAPTSTCSRRRGPGAGRHPVRSGRSYYGRLVPPDKSSEFFGFYNMMGKASAIIGPTLVASRGGHGRLAALDPVDRAAVRRRGALLVVGVAGRARLCIGFALSRRSRESVGDGGDCSRTPPPSAVIQRLSDRR